MCEARTLRDKIPTTELQSLSVQSLGLMRHSQQFVDSQCSVVVFRRERGGIARTQRGKCKCKSCVVTALWSSAATRCSEHVASFEPFHAKRIIAVAVSYSARLHCTLTTTANDSRTLFPRLTSPSHHASGQKLYHYKKRRSKKGI